MPCGRLGLSDSQLSARSPGAGARHRSQTGRDAVRKTVRRRRKLRRRRFRNAEGYANGETERVIGDVIADLRLKGDGGVRIEQSS